MKIMLTNDNGIAKEVKIGFSWTNLFFGFFTPMFRGDVKWAIIQFVSAVITYGISSLIFPFFYNKLYIKDLLEKGFKPATEGGRKVLVLKGFLVEEGKDV